MAERIKVGEKVVGSTGYGQWGNRQIIGRYCGKTDDGYHQIQEEPNLMPLIVVSVRRVRDLNEEI